jgi:hypothetical protein
MPEMKPSAFERFDRVRELAATSDEPNTRLRIEGQKAITKAFRDGIVAERSRIVALLQNLSPEIIGTLVRAHCVLLYGTCEWPTCSLDPDCDYTCGNELDGMRAVCSALAEMIENPKEAKLMADRTYFYGDEAARLVAAQSLYETYCRHLFTDPARAKTQMIAGIQSALGQAFSQGLAENRRPEIIEGGGE